MGFLIYFAAGGDGSVDRVCGDLFDEEGWLFFRFTLRQVEAGDLQSVEEEAGSAGIYVVGSYSLEDHADGVLDGASIFRVGENEDFAVNFSGFEVGGGYGVAGGVVVVAEIFSAEPWAETAAAVGEDMAA